MAYDNLSRLSHLYSLVLSVLVGCLATCQLHPPRKVWERWCHQKNEQASLWRECHCFNKMCQLPFPASSQQSTLAQRIVAFLPPVASKTILKDEAFRSLYPLEIGSRGAHCKASGFYWTTRNTCVMARKKAGFGQKNLLEPEKSDEFGIKSLECSYWLSSSHIFWKVFLHLQCTLHQFQISVNPYLMPPFISFSVRNGALQSCGFAAESTQIALHGGALKYTTHKPQTNPKQTGKLTYM